MARVTVEDCVLRIPNRFELVLLSAERARELSSGFLPTVMRDNDKAPIIALREIAEETISIEGLRENLLQALQRSVYGFSKGKHDDEMKEAMDREYTSHLKTGDLQSQKLAIPSSDDEEGDDEITE